MGWSDETLKQAVEQVQDALEALRKLQVPEGEEAEVEAHSIAWSDENLKRAVTSLRNALQTLKTIETKPKA
jgi:hypothetical protein